MESAVGWPIAIRTGTFPVEAREAEERNRIMFVGQMVSRLKEGLAAQQRELRRSACAASGAE